MASPAQVANDMKIRAADHGVRMMDIAEAKARLILTAHANVRAARWWTLATAWVFGRHLVVCHLGRAARIGIWRGAPYLLTFREAQ